MKRRPECASRLALASSSCHMADFALLGYRARNTLDANEPAGRCAPLETAPRCRIAQLPPLASRQSASGSREDNQEIVERASARDPSLAG